jgi:hypothetical protein
MHSRPMVRMTIQRSRHFALKSTARAGGERLEARQGQAQQDPSRRGPRLAITRQPALVPGNINMEGGMGSYGSASPRPSPTARVRFDGDREQAWNRVFACTHARQLCA